MKILKTIKNKEFGEVHLFEKGLKYWGKEEKIIFFDNFKQIPILLGIYDVDVNFKISDEDISENEFNNQLKRLKETYERFIKDFNEKSEILSENILESIKEFLKEFDDSKYMKSFLKTKDKPQEYIILDHVEIFSDSYTLVIKVIFLHGEMATISVHEEDIRDEYSVQQAMAYEADMILPEVEEI